MKITLLTESFPPVMDGAAATVDSYARCIHERGGAVTVVVPRMPAHGEYEPPYPVIYYPSIGTVADGEYPFGFPYLPRTLKACREYAPDIIHAHSPFMSMTLALRMRRKLGKPVILTVHAKYAEELERYTRSPFMRRRALEMMMKHVNAADEVWVSSLSAAQELKRMGYTGGHFHLPKGTDFTVRETESDTISELRTRFSIPYNVPILLYVGRLVWQKNIRGILDALDILRERRQPFCMLFVGDGPDRTAMEDYTAARRLDGLVHFVGRVSDRTLLQAFYSFADLLVFPSLADNGPQVILEAAACSLPALAATGGAASELIEDGVSGFICSPEAKQLADGIEVTLSDRRLLRRAGAAARTYIHKPWGHIVERACRRYETVAKLYKSKQTELEYARTHSRVLNTPPVKLRRDTAQI